MTRKKYELTRDNMTIVLKNAFNKKVIENLEITEHNLLLGLLGRLKEKGLAEVCVTFDEASMLIGGANTRPFYVDSIGLSRFRPRLNQTDSWLVLSGWGHRSVFRPQSFGFWGFSCRFRRRSDLRSRCTLTNGQI